MSCKSPGLGTLKKKADRLVASPQFIGTLLQDCFDNIFTESLLNFLNQCVLFLVCMGAIHPAV